MLRPRVEYGSGRHAEAMRRLNIIYDVDNTRTHQTYKVFVPDDKVYSVELI